METTITSYEETGSTTYHAVEVEVMHNGRTFAVDITLCTETDTNCGHTETNVVNAEFQDGNLPEDESDKILEMAKKAALDYDEKSE